MNQCAPDCRRTTYQVITTKDKWPFKDIIESATEEEMRKIEIRQKSSAFVSIRYSTFFETVRDFKPRFESFEAFLAGIGGLISMWIGINVMSIFDILASIIGRCRQVTI